MKTIIHISADFPDPLVPTKSKAVQSLIDATPDQRHVVYSLNRVSWRSGIVMQRFGDHTAIAYGAPPYGLRLAHHLAQVAGVIIDDCRRRRLPVDLIHAHKFTVEGVVAFKLARAIDRPFIVNLWGNTDRRVFDRKPALRNLYREIACNAAKLLPAAPWIADYFAAVLGMDRARFELLPIMTSADAILAPVHSAEPRLLSMFQFDHWKHKGFDLLVGAMASLSRDMPGLSLDLYGRGGPRALLDMTALINKAGVGARVKLMPALDHVEVQTVMNAYAGFALPSRSETYGMVFAEALLAGVPILWPQGQAVDGYFDEANVGYRCRPDSIEDVARGLRHLIAHQAELKQRIGTLQTQGALERLQRHTIGAQYAMLLSAAMGQAGQAASAA